MGGTMKKMKLQKEKPRHSLNPINPQDLIKVTEQTTLSKDRSLSPGMKRQSNEAQLSIAKLCQSLKESNLGEDTPI